MRHFSAEHPPVNEEFVNNLAKTTPFFVKTRRAFKPGRPKMLSFFQFKIGRQCGLGLTSSEIWMLKIGSPEDKTCWNGANNSKPDTR
jgi:hypothetical protein